MIFFTSDLHLSHANVIKYDNRPFKTVEEMDTTLINNWNSVVKDGDLVYVLGDFGFAPLGRIKELLDALNGTKYLILGNHDRHQHSAYIKAGFSCVCYEITIRFGQTIFKMSHYPYRVSRLKQWWEMFRLRKDYTQINKKRPTRGIEAFLLHGHTHKGSVILNKKKKQIHVGCYLHAYTPVSLEKIFSIVQKAKEEDYTTLQKIWNFVVQRRDK